MKTETGKLKDNPNVVALTQAVETAMAGKPMPTVDLLEFLAAGLCAALNGLPEDVRRETWGVLSSEIGGRLGVSAVPSEPEYELAGVLARPENDPNPSCPHVHVMHPGFGGVPIYTRKDEGVTLKPVQSSDFEVPEGCKLVAHNNEDGWYLSLVRIGEGEVERLEWPASWPEKVTSVWLEERGFEVV